MKNNKNIEVETRGEKWLHTAYLLDMTVIKDLEKDLKIFRSLKHLFLTKYWALQQELLMRQNLSSPIKTQPAIPLHGLQ